MPMTTISRRLMWLNMLVGIFALVLAGGAFLTYDQITFRHSLEGNLSAQARIIAANTVTAITFNDPHAAKATLDALQNSPDILSAGIMTKPEDRQFAEFSRAGQEHVITIPEIAAGQVEAVAYQGEDLVLVRAITLDGKPIGTVYLRADARQVDKRLLQYAGIAAVVLFFSLVVALLLSSTFRKAVTAPIVQLAAVARTVSRERDYSVRAPHIEAPAELAALVTAFNDMLSQIQLQNEAVREAQSGLERKVQDRTRQLVAANRELEAFSYSVSHDLRNPLDALNGFLHILRTDYGAQLGPDGLEHVQNMQVAARRMAELIEDLLNLARVNTTAMHPEKLDLADIAREVAETLTRREPQRKIHFVSAQCESVEGDRRLLRIVLENLLGNAWKYTSRRPEADVEFGCERRSGLTVFYVRDNGAGFDASAADRLFQPFQRLHSASEFPGSGVGLATVQRIIARHGGEVWAASSPGEGATFFFTLGQRAHSSLAHTG
jgi:signal transduction histidine kinase